MQIKNILISGAGVAGLTLAYWLKHYGFNTVIVEKHPALRTGGYQEAFAKYEKELRPFITQNQELAKLSASIMTESTFSNWLYRLAALLPASVILYFKNRSLKNTTKAANALKLKKYH